MTVTNQFAAHVGLDLADKKHDVCVQFKNGERVFDVIEHTAEALDAWLTELHQKVRHCCKVSDEAAFCLIQRPYISKTLLTRRISPRGSP